MILSYCVIYVMLKKKEEMTFLELLSQIQVLLLFLNLFYIKFVFCYSTFWSIFM